MVKFVGTDVTGLPLKRKQVAQACDSCRQRKKRCCHELSSNTSQTEMSSNASNAERRNDTSPTNATPHSDPGLGRDKRQVTSTNDHNWTANGAPTPKDNQSRFVGDLNPEGLFFEAIGSTSTRDRSGSSGVGVWLSLGASPGISAQQSSTLTLNKLLASYVRVHCLVCLPPLQDRISLKKIYHEKVYPIWPIITPEVIVDPKESPTSVVLQQAICLSAATETSAESHLRLAADGPLLSRQEFVRTISTAIHITIEAGLITDRLVLLRLLLVLAMWWEPSSSEDADMPSLIYSRAVHHLQSLGLHLPGAQTRVPDEDLESLFCGAWVMDKLNGAIYGKPCLIHERDIGRDLDSAVRRQSPCFQLLLRVAQLVEQVIGIYRPAKNLQGEQEFVTMEIPVFEAMILDAGANKVPGPLLATIEVLYHSVAIVSCRATPRDVSQIPGSSINSRRSLSADRITSIISQEFQGELTYLPIVPYAVSLSLSVAYRKMRYSAVPMYRSRGKRAFTANCALLRDIGKLYWRANVIANMAEQVLQEMGKAMAVLCHDAQVADGANTSEVENSQDQEHAAAQPHVPTLPAHPSRPAPQELGELSAANFDAMPDLDLFGYIDPDFNLGAVDATMEGHLDVGLPSNWADWQVFGG